MHCLTNIMLRNSSTQTIQFSSNIPYYLNIKNKHITEHTNNNRSSPLEFPMLGRTTTAAAPLSFQCSAPSWCLACHLSLLGYQLHPIHPDYKETQVVPSKLVCQGLSLLLLQQPHRPINLSIYLEQTPCSHVPGL